MKLSIIIPCFNESKTISLVIDNILSCAYKNIEIILVDDCSTDGTQNIIKDQLINKISKVIFHKKNLGKGAAVRSGVNLATGDIIIIQDADLEYDPMDYKKLINPIIIDKADVVYGSRFIGSQPHRVVFFWHQFGNKILTLFSNIFTRLNLTDMETCYKVFRSNVIKNIKIEENRFGFEPEITAKISKKNIRIYEVGISYYGRTYAEGKKITWKDGFRAIYCIIKYNLFR
jgi:glycosyltransferase involved in cell wall biosynthesis